jgi:hypothetical protein
MADSLKKEHDTASGDSCSKRFEDFQDFTYEERKRAERRRDYRDLKQWTEDQAEILRAREQAPIAIDFFGKKVDALMGVEINRRTDPKAYPRTPEHEQAADAITDALRYVEESTQFDAIATEVFEEKIVEGYAGAVIDVTQNAKGEYDVAVLLAHWDRVYFDPHSREKDFSDSTYFGITTWLDVADAKDLFPESAADLDNMLGSTTMRDTSFDDRPVEWVDRYRKRVRINQEWYLESGVWMLVYYSDTLVLREPAKSHLLDADGQPCCPMELQSDYVDRDNNRYGYTERFIDSQDEVNHRRSKALYMLSSAQVIAEQGAVKDKDATLRELRKAQGYTEIAPNKKFEIDRNIEMGQAQLAFYQEAKAEIEADGVNPELAGRTDQAISGRAFMARQQGGITQLGHIYSRHSEWKKRVYRQMWARIRQYWTEQKWIRVTDNDDALRWVGLNIPVTMIEQIIEQKTGMDLAQIRRKYGQEMQQYVQRDPRLGAIVETRNEVAEIDVDILIDEAPDTITMQQEQFETLAKLLSSNVPPPMLKALVELSSLRNKKRFIDALEGDEQTKQARQQQEQQQQEIAQRGAVAEIREKETKADLNEASAADKMASAEQRQASTHIDIADAIHPAPALPAPPSATVPAY